MVLLSKPVEPVVLPQPEARVPQLLPAEQQEFSAVSQPPRVVAGPEPAEPLWLREEPRASQLFPALEAVAAQQLAALAWALEPRPAARFERAVWAAPAFPPRVQQEVVLPREAAPAVLQVRPAEPVISPPLRDAAEELDVPFPAAAVSAALPHRRAWKSWRDQSSA